MAEQPGTALARRSCRGCEGGLPPLSEAEARTYLSEVPGWEIVDEGRRLRRRWVARGFRAAVAFLDRVAELAESEGHHPDLHLERYRHVWIELTTFAIHGLSENDFILAAKIDRLPIDLQRHS